MDDHSLALRRGIVAALKGSAEIAAIVGARVYDEAPAKPTWPFIRYGFPIETRVDADGWEGSSFALSVHVFAKGPGTDSTSGLAALVRKALHEKDFLIDSSGGIALLQYSQTTTLRDTDEAGAYHAVVQFDAVTLELVE